MLDRFAPLNISKKALFAPANGNVYTKQDFKRCYSQQPLPLMPSYLWAKDCLTLDPPTFYFGYDIGEIKALAIVRKYFPNCIVWTTPDEDEDESDVDCDDEEQGDGEEEESRVPHVVATFRSQPLSDALVEHFGLPDVCRYMISVELFIRKDGETVWGLSLGSNYTGVIPEHLDAPILEPFDISATEMGMWYLDPAEWRWLPKDY